MEAQADVEERLEGIQTQRLLRRARKYYIVTPEIRRTTSEDDWEDKNWKRGWASDTWYLKPAAIASLQREIQEAKKRRAAEDLKWTTRFEAAEGVPIHRQEVRERICARDLSEK